MFGPLIVNPAKSKGDKTGSWRVQVRPEYLRKNCIACKMCQVVCPENCVSGKEKNTFAADFTYCKGCGLCAMVCPKQDIEMVQEASGESKR